MASLLRKAGDDFEWLKPGDVRKLPKQPTLVCDLLTCGSVSMIYGAPSTGKSAGVLALSFHLAMADDPRFESFGPFYIPNRMAVIYFIAEGQHSLGDRIAAFEKHYGVDCSGAPVYFIPKQARLFTADPMSKNKPLPAERELLAINSLIHRVEEDCGLRVGLIVFDTFSRSLGDALENSNDDMRRVMEIVRAITDKEPPAPHVLLVHHNARSTGLERGATAVAGDLDQKLKASPATDKTRIAPSENDRMSLPVGIVPSDPTIIEIEKNRDGGKGVRIQCDLWPIHVRTEAFKNEKTRPIYAIVCTRVVAGSANVSARVAAAAAGDARKIMALIEQMDAEGTAPILKDDLRKRWRAQSGKKADAARKAVDRALEALEKAGKVIVNGETIALRREEAVR